MEDKLNMIKVKYLSNHSWNIFVQSQFLLKFMNIYLNEYENNWPGKEDIVRYV